MSADNPFAASTVEALPVAPVRYRGLYSTARWKVVSLSVLTAGLYEFLWFWRNFRRRPGLGDAIGAALGTLFRIFTTHALFREIHTARARAGLPEGAFRPGAMATLYVLVVLATMFGRVATGDETNLATVVVLPVGGALLRALPLAAAQAEINRAFEAAEPNGPRNDRVDVWYLLAVAVCVPFWILAVIGAVLG